jgi:hypothetical protein
MGVGSGIGQAVAGFIGSVYGWRLPFLLVGSPALFFGVLILLTGQEPERGRNEINTNEFINVDNNRLSHRHDMDCGNTQLQQHTINTHKCYNEYTITHDTATNDDSPTGADETGNNIGDNNSSSSSNQTTYQYSEKIDFQKIGRLFLTRSVLIIFVQGIPGCMVSGSTNGVI